ALDRRHQAALGVVPHRDERVAFRVVAADATLRNVVLVHDKAVDPALDAIIGGGDETHRRAFGKREPVDVALVHEQHHAGALDPAKPVALGIDARVELALAAKRGELEYRRVVRLGGKRLWRDEIRLAAFGLPFAVPRGKRAVEPAGLPHALVEAVKILRIGLRDRVADAGVIGDPAIPVDARVGRQGSLGELGDNPRLRAQILARRFGDATRAVDAGGAVFHADR